MVNLIGEFYVAHWKKKDPFCIWIVYDPESSGECAFPPIPELENICRSVLKEKFIGIHQVSESIIDIRTGKGVNHEEIAEVARIISEKTTKKAS